MTDITNRKDKNRFDDDFDSIICKIFEKKILIIVPDKTVTKLLTQGNTPGPLKRLNNKTKSIDKIHQLKSSLYKNVKASSFYLTLVMESTPGNLF